MSEEKKEPEVSEEEKLLTEALIRNGTHFLLENGILSDAVINDLILFGFNVDEKVVDVEIFVNKEEKLITYELSYTRFTFLFRNKEDKIKELREKLQEIVQSGLKEYKVDLKVKRYNP